MALSNIIGFDDAPFDKTSDAPVTVVGAVFAGTRMHGVMSFEVARDGSDSAEAVIEAIRSSRFVEHLQLVMLQGIAFGGFNVVDVFEVHETLRLPVMVVSRKEPDREAIRRVLLERIPEGGAKWSVLERLGEMESVRGVWIQRVGLDLDEAEEALGASVVEGYLPEPLRVAHMIAGGIVRGESGGRP